MKKHGTRKPIECAECGKLNRPSLKFCWLCGTRLKPARTSSRRIDKETSLSVLENNLPVIICGIILLMLFVDLILNNAWGLAIVLLVLLLPPAVATLVKSVNRQNLGEAMTASQKITSFLLSLFVTIGCVVAVGVAGVVALFFVCLSMMANM